MTGADPDSRSVAAVVERFVAILDRQDGTAAAALFAEDGCMVVHPPPPGPGATHVGAPAIATLISALSRYDRTDHRLGHHRSSIHGEIATSVTRCEAHHVAVVDGVEVDRVVTLAYHDTFRRDAGTWSIVEREVRMAREDMIPIPGERWAELERDVR